MESTRPKPRGPSRQDALCSIALVCVLSLFLPVIARAQDDVAEAARQEKARKEAQAKKSRHVYTNEDLNKKEILDPEDRAAVEAKKKETAPAPGVAPTAPADSENAQPTESLGEVARRYRAEKEARQAEETLRKQTPSQFPMDIAQPALAHPIQPAETRKKVPIAAPKFDVPRTGKTRDPFSRNPVPERKAIAPSAPSLAVAPKAIVVLPVAPKVSAEMVAPAVPSSNAAVTTATVTIKTGDSLWKISKQYLGGGSRWHELVAANPSVTVPTRVLPGTVLKLPAAVGKTLMQVTSVSQVKIQKGDSLWRIALSVYGTGSSWTCLAQANPSLRDANEIFAGQTLLVPASCSARR
jgi:nucleoid-associated protein YgaU